MEGAALAHDCRIDVGRFAAAAIGLLLSASWSLADGAMPA